MGKKIPNYGEKNSQIKEKNPQKLWKRIQDSWSYPDQNTRWNM